MTIFKKIFLTGVSGTGKSAVCRELQRLGVVAIGIDETPGLCCWLNKQTKEKVTEADFTAEFIATHGWFCDLGKLQKIITGYNKPLVVCGSIENIVEGMRLCDVTLLLVCSPKTFISRIGTRTDNEYGKSDTTKSALLNYYQDYNQTCLEAGAVAVDAERPLSVVVDEVLTYLRQ